jgi:hypothetical protein
LNVILARCDEICRWVQKRLNAWRNFAYIECVAVIDDNVCPFDLPDTVFFFDFDEHAVGVDVAGFLYEELPVFFTELNVALSGFQIIYASDN